MMYSSDLEYKELMHLREMWSAAILKWGQIMIPLTVGIIAFFVSKLPDVEPDFVLMFLLAGLFIISLVLGYWRYTVHQIDKSIVFLYPRLLEIELEKNMELQTAYFFNYLSKSGIETLSSELNTPVDEIEILKYIDFKELSVVKEHSMSPQELLLEVWKTHGFNSVTSRGHSHQNLVAGLIILGYFFFMLAWVYLLYIY